MPQWQLKPARDIALAGTERHRSYQRENGVFAKSSQFVWWMFVRSFLRSWNRLEIRGRRNLPPEPPFVLVSNHCSHLDALVLGAALPIALRNALFPLAAGDVFFETPAMAAFAATFLNALPVWRKNPGHHAIKDLRARLLEEQGVYILFPEGGRSRDGNMTSFKAGVGMLIAESPVPVIPCYLRGTFNALPPSAKWVRPSKISLWIGKPRSFVDVRNRRKGWDEIAHTLEQDVRLLGNLPAATCTEQCDNTL